MKQVLLTGVILLNILFVSAQEHLIKKDKKQLYIIHKVETKETLFSLGRLYNLTHKEIAAANKIDANAGLKLGQQIKIPLNKSNFVQSGQKKKGYETVYHKINSGDNLYKISKNYNSVKEDQLRKWNKLSKNIVKPGQEIIVGFVKVGHIKQPEKEEKKAVAVVPTNDINKWAPVTETKIIDEPPVVSVSEKKAGKVDTVKEEHLVFTGNTEDVEGYFAGQFAVNNAAAQPKILTGYAATFKSTSGWGDRKYYILINNIPAGTILKINANNKTIYAKVLESLPEIKDNNGLLCRLTNAAASALGIIDQKFEVELYFSE